MGLRDLLARADGGESQVTTLLAIVWAISAAVCVEAYAEIYGGTTKKNWQLPAAIVSCVPLLNTYLASIYAVQKLRRD